MSTVARREALAARVLTLAAQYNTVNTRAAPQQLGALLRLRSQALSR